MRSKRVERHRAHFHQLEHDQHLQRVLRVARGIGAQIVEPRRSDYRARATTSVNGAPWPGMTTRTSSVAIRSSTARCFGETAFAFEFRKDHAEAVFPQRVGADEHALLRRNSSISECGSWPGAPSTDQSRPPSRKRRAGLDRAGEIEALAALAGRAEGRARLRPSRARRRLRSRESACRKRRLLAAARCRRNGPNADAC